VEAPAADPWAATGATSLSPVAAMEIRGRSLLPAAPRSLLREAPVNRFAAPVPVSTPIKAGRESWRRVLGWVVVAVLLAATVAAVAYAVTRR